MKKKNSLNYIVTVEANLITKFTELRKQANYSQQKMADTCDVIRETISRIETKSCSPNLNTLLKLLEPLGYTLEIVPIKKNNIV